MSTSDAIRSYPRFLWRGLGVATDGGLLFYTWMFALTAIFLVGANAWAHQVNLGLGLTAMTDHVSWGLYIGNFNYGVALAAGAVMMVIPAYLYGDREMHDVVIVGELLAIAAIIGCLMFVTVDIGRLDKSWHLIPGLGHFNWPISMLSWDVVGLFGYLVINLHVVGYLLYMRYLGRTPDKRWYRPFVFLSIIWAVSISTSDAFLYSGLGGRPFWNTAVLAPRSLASAFVSGPAFILLALQLLRHFSNFHVGSGPLRTLLRILQVTVLANLFLMLSELFTAFYTGGLHSTAVTYLFFGLHGHDALVPWIWTAIVLDIAAALLFLLASPEKHLWWINAGCVFALVGLWIDKGLGLVVPGFVPSTLHEVVEYLPNQLEWKVSAGIIALVLMVFTVGLKLSAAVFTGELSSTEEG